HAFATIETALVMIAAALFCGAAEQPRNLGLCLAAGAIGIAAGLHAMPYVSLWPGLWRFPLVLALLAGAIVAVGSKPFVAAQLAISVVAGGVLGIAATPGGPGLIRLAEAWAAAVIAFTLAMTCFAWPRATFGYRAVRLGARILGAWIMAISALGLAAPGR
ncbi:MAG: hypothetical protein JSS20_05735, partial [Proteobacteria bacterium]|nr:hypothetical protein [Pseudomonadota bacterium]